MFDSLAHDPGRENTSGRYTKRVKLENRAAIVCVSLDSTKQAPQDWCSLVCFGNCDWFERSFNVLSLFDLEDYDMGVSGMHADQRCAIGGVLGLRHCKTRSALSLEAALAGSLLTFLIGSDSNCMVSAH